MYQFSLMQKIVHRAKRIIDTKLCSYHRSQLNNTNFSIISNNCWGGVCYEYFGLKKLSPTVGCYFFAEDYVRFVTNLKYYLSKEIEMIDAESSKHKESLRQKGQMNLPVGKLDDDVEVIFMHYRDPQVAKSKWERRCSRVNFNNLIFKFSYMNECNDELVHQFEKIKGAKKLFISSHPFDEYENIVLSKYISKDGQVGDDVYFWKKGINIIRFINSSPNQ